MSNFYSNWKLCFLLLIFGGCTQGIQNTVKIDKNGWAIDKKYVLNFEVTDTLTKKNLILHLNHNDEYPFENIFLIMDLHGPKGYQNKDTLEYTLANINGKWIGNGWGKNKEIELYYKEKIHLKKGKYTLKIKQAMRKRNELKGVDFLKGICKIGIRLKNN